MGDRGYYEAETVTVDVDDDGVKVFIFHGRDGKDDIGPEIRMSADNYNVGTVITLMEKVQ